MHNKSPVERQALDTVHDFVAQCDRMVFSEADGSTDDLPAGWHGLPDAFSSARS